jgi:uroporphyrinogen-III synthase
MLIWVTRTGPDNLRTAQRLRELGHRPLIQPALRVRQVAHARLAAQPDAIVFTSAHGVRYHDYPAADRALPVFTVGDRTAEAAREAGYRSVTSADGDVGALFRLLRTSLPSGARIGYFGARETAGDLAGDLIAAGYAFERTVVYETIPASDEDLEGVKAALPTVQGILIHSAKGARRARELIDASGWRGRIWCIAPACAQPFDGLAGVEVSAAAVPTEDGVFATIPAIVGRVAERGVFANDNAEPDAVAGSDDFDGPPPPSAA